MSTNASDSQEFAGNALQIIEGNAEYVRNNRRYFIRPGPVSGADLAGRIASGALLLECYHVLVFRQGDWWLIAGKSDWIGNHADRPMSDPFARVFPFPEAGDNMSRPEILLPAFAQDVITSSADGLRVVKGDVVQNDPICTTVKSNPDWKRVVAFRLPVEE